MWTRRETVVAGLLTILYGASGACACAPGNARTRPRRGCVLTASEAQPYLAKASDTRVFLTGKEPMIPRSGNRNFDLALARTLSKAASVLEVLPGFAYYEDYDEFNAYATPAVRRDRADGTVLFGGGLLLDLMRGKESPEVSVAAVCAHEFGHIVQFKHDLQKVVQKGQKTARRGELQADFLAGYFAGVRKREKPDFPAAVFAATQSKFGDLDVDSPGHHGTPAERGAAIVKGFEAAYRQRLSLADTIVASTNYVTAL